MEKTIVTFLIQKPFVQGNRYVISVNQAQVTVEISRSTSLNDLNRIQVTIEFPFKFKDSMISECIKKECVICLNRLIDVVRYKTRYYFIERVTEHDIFLFDFRTVDNDGKVRLGGAMDFSGPYFPLNSIPENEVESEISEMLMNQIAFHSMRIYVDSFHYFSTRQFNVAVIIANIALESIVANHLYNKLLENDLSPIEADSEIEDLFSLKRADGEKGGLHKVHL